MGELEDEIISICDENYKARLAYLKETNEDIFTFDLSLLADETREKLLKNFDHNEVDNKINDVIESIVGHSCFIKYTNTGNDYRIKNLTSDNIGELVELNCVVISASSPQSIPEKLCYRCMSESCSFIYYYKRGQDIPKSCPDCSSNLELDESNTKWMDYQVLSVQESPETMVMGETPRPLRIRLTGSHLVDSCKVGDNIKVIGTMSTEPSNKKGVYSWYIMGNNIVVSSMDVFEAELTNTDIAILENWAMRDDIEQVLINSLFPSIYGNDDEKLGLTLSLFGGKAKERRDVNIRSSINVLLIGDPSTAKTAMINAMARQAPKSIYTQAGGVTGVGLTAAAIKDEGQWVLAAGSVVLANGGICCIDELEKMNKEDQDKILECMEKQTVSIHKASIHTTLPAKTTILAAGNPKYGDYKDEYTLSENINLPSPLLARFDLIFIMKDIPDVERDSAIAEKIIKGYIEDGSTDDNIMDIDTLKKYVIYAKRLEPEITEEAMEMLMNFYVLIRQEERGADDPIPITARQLQGLVRMSVAFSRLKLSEVVGFEEASRAKMLYEEILKRVGSQITTGGEKYTRKDEKRIIEDICPLNTAVYWKAIEKKAEKQLSKDNVSKLISTIKGLLNQGYFQENLQDGTIIRLEPIPAPT
jgi:replicative DNA helicase Mcm